MALAKGSTLLLAALMDGPALWRAFGTHELAAGTALLRYLVAVPVSAVLLAVLRAVTGPYRAAQEAAEQPLRAVASRLDVEDGEGRAEGRIVVAEDGVRPVAAAGMVQIPLPTKDRQLGT